MDYPINCFTPIISLTKNYYKKTAAQKPNMTDIKFSYYKFTNMCYVEGLCQRSLSQRTEVPGMFSFFFFIRFLGNLQTKFCCNSWYQHSVKEKSLFHFKRFNVNISCLCCAMMSTPIIPQLPTDVINPTEDLLCPQKLLRQEYIQWVQDSAIWHKM